MYGAITLLCHESVAQHYPHSPLLSNIHIMKLLFMLTKFGEVLNPLPGGFGEAQCCSGVLYVKQMIFSAF